LFMGVTALVNILLFRYSGQPDLVIGTPVAGREHPDLEGQVGYYLNTLALRNQINGEDSFFQVLDNVRQRTVEAFSHQSYPFDLLVEELGLGSDQSRSPLFDVVVILQNIDLNNDEALQLNGVKVSQEPARIEISKSDLRFQFIAGKQNGILYGNIEYNTDIFDLIRIERMAHHLCQLLEAVTSDPLVSVNMIEYLSRGEKEQEQEVLRLFNSNIEEAF